MEQMTKVLSETMSGFSKDILNLSEGIINAQKEKDVKVLGTMPTLEAADADGFKYELNKLLRYFDDAHVTNKRTWFRKVRNNLKRKSNAETQFNYIIDHDIGGSEKYAD